MIRAGVTLFGVALVLAAWAGAAHAQLYRWVDEQGVAHYGHGIDAVPERFRKGIQPYVPPEVKPADKGPTHREQIHPMCGKARTVDVGLDVEVARVFKKVFTDEVRKDIFPFKIETFIVLDEQQYPAGFICYGREETRLHTIIVPVNTLVGGLGAAELERQLAQLLAHELAHATRHATHDGRAGQVEREADELGVYYYERAGYDCRSWIPINPPHHGYADRAMVQLACYLAKQGLRPPRRPLATPR
ncbi:MAG TPA: DUF4124 domain-containing protein [Methylomirabilota bacterium]|nr:DUF4124 domain-containing protein [Methylomirabilota bacterium]